MTDEDRREGEGEIVQLAKGWLLLKMNRPAMNLQATILAKTVLPDNTDCPLLCLSVEK